MSWFDHCRRPIRGRLKRAALPLIEEAQRLVDSARKSLVEGSPAEIAPAMIQVLAAAHTARLMKNDETLRANGLGYNKSIGAFLPDGNGMTDDDLQVYRDLIGRLDSLSRDEVAKTRGSEAIHLVINKAVKDAGIVLHPNDPAWRQLEIAFVKAQRKAIHAISSRLTGEDIATPAPPRSQGLPLTRALKKWSQAESRSAKKQRQESIDEAGRAVQRFVELHGDLDVAIISKTHTFRHTFKRASREAGISEEVHHAFTGHAGGGVGRSYGRIRRSDGIMDRGISLERLKTEIDRVEFPQLSVPTWPKHS